MEEVRRRERVEADLQRFGTQLLIVQDRERRLLAWELFDTIAQRLAVVGMNLGILEERQEHLPRSRDNKLLSQSSALVQDLLRQVSSLSYFLHPPALDDMGLSAAFQWYVEEFTRKSGVQIELEVPTDLGRLPLDFEIAIFRLVQEALSNVWRHSGSPMAWVRVSRSSTEVAVEIKDQGRGIPPDMLPISAWNVSAGIGIRTMYERVRRLAGTLSFHSGAQGTVVMATFPLPQNQQATAQAGERQEEREL
jgi:signal transduction histidine kinase